MTTKEAFKPHRLSELRDSVCIFDMPHLSEAAVQAAFVGAFNQLYGGRERLAEDYAVIIQALTNASALDKEAAAQQSECDVVMELIRKCVDENARSAQDQEKYQQRYGALAARHETAKHRLDGITGEKQARAAKREIISRFIADLEKCGGLLTEFDEQLWCETVETVTVHSESNMAVTFKDGNEINVNLQEVTI